MTQKEKFTVSDHAEPSTNAIEIEIPLAAAGQRVDAALADLIPELSRARVQSLLRSGDIVVNGTTWRPATRVHGGERASVTYASRAATTWIAQAMPLDVVSADKDVVVINKPAGLVVHPGAGNPDGTLVNALLAAFPELESLPRGGVVHRLDKDTSGIMVVARSELAHRRLVDALAAREVRREYVAIVRGVPTAGARIDAPIGRHPKQRTRMAVVTDGKPAISDYRVTEKFAHYATLRVRLQTGRTHQIRVHMAHIGYPIVGDTTYAGRPRIAAGLADSARLVIAEFPRQALHAQTLAFTHPRSNTVVQFTTPLPRDIETLQTALRHATEQL